MKENARPDWKDIMMNLFAMGFKNFEENKDGLIKYGVQNYIEKKAD